MIQKFRLVAEGSARPLIWVTSMHYPDVPAIQQKKHCTTMLISWTARMSSAYDGYRYGLAGRAARTSGPDVQEQKSAP